MSAKRPGPFDDLTLEEVVQLLHYRNSEYARHNAWFGSILPLLGRSKPLVVDFEDKLLIAAICKNLPVLHELSAHDKAVIRIAIRMLYHSDGGRQWANWLSFHLVNGPKPCDVSGYDVDAYYHEPRRFGKTINWQSSADRKTILQDFHLLMKEKRRLVRAALDPYMIPDLAHMVCEYSNLK